MYCVVLGTTSSTIGTKRILSIELRMCVAYLFHFHISSDILRFVLVSCNCIARLYETRRDETRRDETRRDETRCETREEGEKNIKIITE